MQPVLGQSIGIGPLGGPVAWLLLLVLGSVVSALHLGLYVAYTFPLVRSRLSPAVWRQFRFIPFAVFVACILSTLLVFLALRPQSLASAFLIIAGVVTFVTAAYALATSDQPRFAAIPIGGFLVVLGMRLAMPLARINPDAIAFLGFLGWHLATLVLTVIWREKRPAIQKPS